MSTPLKDLQGQQFGRLTVIERAPSDRHANTQWRCRCECGNERIVIGRHLRRGAQRSCGCAKSAAISAASTTHGQSTSGGRRHASPTYKSWCAMKERCSNSNHISFPYYGARGITVCDRWANSFEAFLADMGERPAGTSIDRIDPNGNYEPGNCRWASPSEQIRNRR